MESLGLTWTNGNLTLELVTKFAEPGASAQNFEDAILTPQPLRLAAGMAGCQKRDRERRKK